MRRIHTALSGSLAGPTALLGTIALALTSSPAHADAGHGVSSRTPAPAPHGATARPVAATATPPTHTVAQGDTVSAIAARYGLKTADVLAWNSLGWSSIIRPGDVLALSGPGVAAASAAASAVAPAVAPASVPATIHTVTAGETLWGIAAARGASLAEVLAANGLDRDSIIYPGQQLQIPGAGAAASATPTAATAPPASTADAPVAPNVELDAEQIANARLIIQVGRERGVSDRGIAIALGTAMVESWIRNLDWGDRDSLGLFQQRPSQGWGTPAEVRDPARAAAAFFGGPADPNGPMTRGLLDVSGWEDMSFADAAQAVQRSAYPERYAPWEQQATAWVAAYG